MPMCSVCKIAILTSTEFPRFPLTRRRLGGRARLAPQTQFLQPQLRGGHLAAMINSSKSHPQGPGVVV
jgi:hypothetical protein